jgi:hypothetical protein
MGARLALGNLPPRGWGYDSFRPRVGVPPRCPSRALAGAGGVAMFGLGHWVSRDWRCIYRSHS